MKANKLMAVVCSVIISMLIWVQASSSFNQSNYAGNPVVPQGSTGSTGYTGTTGQTGYTGTTGFTGVTGYTPSGTTVPGTVPGTVPAPTGFTGYTGGPPR